MGQDDTTSPYSVAWESLGLASGTWYVKAMATDENNKTLSDIHTVTIIAYPLYNLEITEPDGGTIGGVNPIRVRVKRRSATLTHLEIKRHEDTTEHAWDWVNVKHGDPPTGLPYLESTSYDSGTGITTDIYRYDWDTTLAHNGNHILYAQGEFVTVPTAMVASEDYGGTAVKNLAIISCVPEGVAPWKGEEGTTVPIQVNLEDNDPNDPMTLTLTLYATNADNRGPWTGIRTITAYNVTGNSYTFYWDGKNNSGEYVEPWTYTFEVDITQTDINYNENPALQVEDSTAYRSRYLDILRSRDAFNNPIYEAEYAGYDEGDPNDPNDDSYLYYIRFYDLKDTLDVDASEGELWLYDPDLEKIYTWDVADLECLIEGHNECDGLHATSTGIMHELLVPVPSSSMLDNGTYRFVLHLKDDHLDKYRDHRKRWARDLNAKKVKINLVAWLNSGHKIYEKDEETIGSHNSLNNDDDNFNQQQDRYEQNPQPVTVTGEDDLTKLTLERTKGLPANSEVSLDYIGTSANLRVWSDATKGTLVSSGQKFPANVETTLWVEGYNASSSSRDCGLQMSLMLDGKTYSDIVKYSVVQISLSDLWFNYSSGTSTGLTATKLTDALANWTTNEFAGYKLNPNKDQWQAFDIISNTQTEITVAGGSNLTAVASMGDNYQVISENEGLDIRKNATTDIELPEWANGTRSNPAAYKLNKAVTVLARFTVAPSDITSAKIKALGSGDNPLGNITEKKVDFANGVTNPQFIRFSAGTTPGAIGKFTQTWDWKANRIDDARTRELAVSTGMYRLSEDTIYTVVDYPDYDPDPNAPDATTKYYPWSTYNTHRPWSEALEHACQWADGKTTAATAAEAVTQAIYSSVGGVYDTENGAPQFTGDKTQNFNLTNFLSKITGVGEVNCYDCGKAVTIFTNVLGTKTTYKYSRPFGYVNCIKPIGCGWTNNPFYDMGYPFSADHIVGEDTDTEPGEEGNWRSSFDNHGFSSIGSNIYDACLKVDTDSNPDYGPPFTETWMIGEAWSSYKSKVVDDNPATTTADPTPYHFYVE